MGNLYIVGTPIGNLDDITYRAVDILKNIDIVACEDTRVTAKLLQKYDIRKKLVSYHAHSKIGKIEYLVDLLKKGNDIALVTDAGTPGISDPASVLVNKAAENNIQVVPIPGASALTSLVSVAGLKEKGFVYLGFLPKKKGRRTILENIKNNLFGNLPIIIYESPYRIIKTMQEFKKIGKFNIVIGRELTKKFEQIKKGSLDEILNYYKNNKNKVKGEFVICLRKQE